MKTLIVVIALVASVLGATEVHRTVGKNLLKQNFDYLHQPVGYYPHQFHYGYQQPYVNYQYAHPQYIQPQYVQPQYVQPKFAHPHVVTSKTIPIAIVRHAAETGIDGSFNYDYETQNGITARASGLVKNLGSKDEAQVMQGTYSYTSPDGIPIETSWVADEYGFRAEGAHLPTPPPIPEAIVRSIAYNQAHPSQTGVEAA